MTKIFTIVGCGVSAENWIPRGHSIGCNDAFKFGKPFDSLLVCNRPSEFRGGRFETIINTPCKDFYSHKPDWEKWFPKWKKISKVGWYGTLHREQVYVSNTSPFIALSLAFHLGATEIIMWGVDFKDHKVYKEGSPETNREVSIYMELIRLMEEQGCKVWLGANGSVFDQYLKVYDTRTI
jgi:hypothetical protein